MRAGLLLGLVGLGAVWGAGCANDTFGTAADAAAPDGSVGSDAASDASPVDATNDAMSPPDAGPPGDANVLVGTPDLQTVDNFETGGNVDAFRFVAAFSGTAKNFHFYASVGTTAGKAVVGLYADNAGPSTLLSSTGFSPLAAGWNVGVANPPVAVTKGSVYWIAVLVPKGLPGELHYLVHPDTGGSPTEHTGGNYFTALQSPWADGDAGLLFTAAPFSAYVSAD